MRRWLVLFFLGVVGMNAWAGEVEEPKPKADVPKAAEGAEAPEEAAIRKALEKRVSFDFVETPLADALAFLQALLGVNVVVSPKVDKQAPTTLKVNDMKVAFALAWLVELHGAKMTIEKGAIFVRPADPKEAKKPAEDKDPDTLKVKDALKGKAISLDFVDTPLRDATSFLQDVLEVAILLDPALPPDLAVTLKVNNMKAEAVLHWIAKLVEAEVEVRQGAAFLRNTVERPKREKPEPKAGKKGEGGEL
jgi:type II secretory pathway component HofQ